MRYLAIAEQLALPLRARVRRRTDTDEERVLRAVKLLELAALRQLCARTFLDPERLLRVLLRHEAAGLVGSHGAGGERRWYPTRTMRGEEVIVHELLS